MTEIPPEPPLFFPPVGPVQGWRDGPVTRATGIPYTSAVRFGLPQYSPDRTEVLLAVTWAPACPQPANPYTDQMIGGGVDVLGFDENCQRLSVTVPADAHPDSRLPVMVWIHGGSNVIGAGDLPQFDPARLVAEQHVIVVTVTYRLGVLGYLGGDGRHANLGLLDQREAFDWVRRNIAAFGGDASNITAFGQSAGADAIVQLLAATADEPALFDRAIIQSAPFGLMRNRSAMTASMRRKAHTLTADAPLDNVLHMQRAIRPSALRFGLRVGMAFGVENGVYPAPPEKALTAAWDAQAHIPVLVGTTATEATYFLHAVPPFRALEKIPVIGPWLTRRLTQALTRRIYSDGADDFAALHARNGERATRYTVTWSAPRNPLRSPHIIDLPLLLGTEESWSGAGLTHGANWEDIDRAGRPMRKLWADFARGDTLPADVTIPGVLEGHQVAPNVFRNAQS